jgi:hypothetical protein
LIDFDHFIEKDGRDADDIEDEIIFDVVFPDLFGIAFEKSFLVEAGVEVYEDVDEKDHDDWEIDGLKDGFVLVAMFGWVRREVLKQMAMGI